MEKQQISIISVNTVHQLLQNKPTSLRDKLLTYLGLLQANRISQLNVVLSKSQHEELLKSLQDFMNSSIHLHQSLLNPYIIKVYTIETQISMLKIIQQPFKQTLDNYNISTLSYSKRLQIVYSLAQALQFLQENNICHRAITPACICICQEGKNSLVSKLNNFRYAIKIGKQIQKQINQPLFAPNRYSAPQLKDKTNSFSFANDVWSLGAIFYHLIFDTIQGISIQSGQVKISYPKSIPVWMAKIIEKMLAHDPKDRFKIVDVVSILRSAFVCANSTSKCLIGMGFNLPYQESQLL